MYYGTIVRCLEDHNDWIKTNVIDIDGKVFFEFIVAVGRKMNGEEFFEYSIIPEDIYNKILANTYSFFINLENSNNISIYDENTKIFSLDNNSISRIRTNKITGGNSNEDN